jgi:hypothetical protein
MFEGSHVPLHKWFQACFLLSTAGDVISAYQLHVRLEVTNKTAVGIVNRLGWIIGRTSSTTTGGCPAPASRGQTAGCSPRASRRSSGKAQSAIGLDELPWLKFPAQPKRQFLRFVETVQEFGCVADEARFEHLLSMIGINPVNHRPRRLAKASQVATGLAAIRPSRNRLERAVA